MSDTLHKFLFANAPVRGEVVQLSKTWQRIQQHHDYPPNVMQLLGEMVAASALLCANLKFNGALIMQIHGDGPLQLLVVECNSDLTLRATAKLAANATLDPAADMQALINTHGKGRCVITLDPKDKLPGQQPYQGIVPLTGTSIAQALEHYMEASEQLHTRLWLAADKDTAAGLLLQQLPTEGGSAATHSDHDAWDRATQLAHTVKPEELLTLPPAALIHRLYWQETLQHSEARSCEFKCCCSRERVGNMLRTLGQEEIESILSEQEQITVHCEYCNQRYDFDAVDCAQLLRETAAGAPSQTRH
ncbi:MAG: Hsp33 family molecular chaperone HslO [Burkholderiaceae bacterium]|nr:MAG: Hsp33 family molecular chaperone HslO [Burkholderiaceae bacterium]